MAQVPVPAPIAHPSLFTSIEEKIEHGLTSAENFVSVLSEATQSKLFAEVESGVSVIYPPLSPYIAELGPVLSGELGVLKALVADLQQIRGIPVTPAV